MVKRIDLWNTNDFRGALREAVEVLQQGQAVGVPTESGYLVCRLPTAHSDKSGELLCFGMEVVRRWCDPLNPWMERHLSKWWPGAVVVELPCTEKTPESLARSLAEDGRIALRVPDDEITADLLRMVGGVLHCSAESPAAYSADAEALIAQAPELGLVLDGGPVRYRTCSSRVRINGDRWMVVSVGVWNEKMLARMTAEVVLFVCTGNTCRSPMAEVLFRKRLTDRLQCSEADLLDRGYAVLSAGLAAVPGMPASPEAVELFRGNGSPLDDHESQYATEELLSRADWIFVMTKSHRQAMLERIPEIAERVRLLSPEGRDVSDPIGGSPEDYRRCRDEIAQHVARQLEQIIATPS